MGSACGDQETEMQEMDTSGPVDNRMSDEATTVSIDILEELEYYEFWYELYQIGSCNKKAKRLNSWHLQLLEKLNYPLFFCLFSEMEI